MGARDGPGAARRPPGRGGVPDPRPAAAHLRPCRGFHRGPPGRRTAAGIPSGHPRLPAAARSPRGHGLRALQRSRGRRQQWRCRRPAAGRRAPAGCAAPADRGGGEPGRAPLAGVRLPEVPGTGRLQGRRDLDPRHRGGPRGHRLVAADLRRGRPVPAGGRLQRGAGVGRRVRRSHRRRRRRGGGPATPDRLRAHRRVPHPGVAATARKAAGGQPLPRTAAVHRAGPRRLPRPYAGDPTAHRTTRTPAGTRPAGVRPLRRRQVLAGRRRSARTPRQRAVRDRPTAPRAAPHRRGTAGLGPGLGGGHGHHAGGLARPLVGAGPAAHRRAGHPYRRGADTGPPRRTVPAGAGGRPVRDAARGRARHGPPASTPCSEC